MIIKDEYSIANQAFIDARDRKIIVIRKLKQLAIQMQENYQHWLWHYLEIEEVG